MQLLFMLILSAVASISCAQPLNLAEEEKSLLEAPDEPMPTGPVEPLKRKVLGGSSRVDIAVADLLNRALNVTASGTSAELGYEICRWNFFSKSLREAESNGIGALLYSTWISFGMSMLGVTVGTPLMYVFVPIFGAIYGITSLTTNDVSGIMRNEKRIRMISQIYRDEGKKRFSPEVYSEIDGIRFKQFNGDIKSINRLADIFSTFAYASEVDWIRERINVYNIKQ